MQENVTEKQEVKERKLDDAVLEKLMEGKNKSTIRKEMHIGYNTAEEAMNRLINGHIITFEEIAKYRREAKKRVFLRYIKEGFSKAQAGVKAHVPSGDIKNVVMELVDEGKLSKLYLEYGNGIREKRKNTVLEKLLEGNTILETIELLGINESVGYVYVRELKEEGRIRDDEIVRKVRRKTPPKEKVSKDITEGTKRQDNAPLQQMTEEEREKRILKLFEAGCNKKQIAGELNNISYRELGKIIAKLVQEGKITPLQTTKSYARKKSKIEDVKASNIERYRIALDNIAPNIERKVIDVTNQKLFFMYCRKMIENGGELSPKDMELLQRAIIYGQADITVEGMRFIGNQCAKNGDLQPAIDAVNKCIQVRGKQEDYEKIKRTLQELQEKVKAKKETCEVER